MEAIFKFNQFGSDLGTRQLGEKVRMQLLNTINNNELTVLDFAGVNVVANSFADECIGKLLEHMPLESLKKKTTFRNVNDLAKSSIATAIRRRYQYIQVQ